MQDLLKSWVLNKEKKKKKNENEVQEVPQW